MIQIRLSPNSISSKDQADAFFLKVKEIIDNNKGGDEIEILYDFEGEMNEILTSSCASIDAIEPLSYLTQIRYIVAK